MTREHTTGKFVAVEGLDGCGKSLQIQLLTNRLKEKQIGYKYLHFPSSGSFPYGDLIARFLRGEFGEANSVNPYLVALLFALDRYEAKKEINEWLSQHLFVIVDRYVYSNIAFQCAKVNAPEEKAQLEQWIWNLERRYHALPWPTLSVYLSVPFQFVLSSLTSKRNGQDRTYLSGKPDIHESDLILQESVHKEYLSLVDNNKDLEMIDCASSGGEMLPPETIHKALTELLMKKNFFSAVEQ